MHRQRAQSGLRFAYTPEFTAKAVAFNPAAGVFIIAVRAAKPRRQPATRPLVEWQPGALVRALRRLAVALGLERA